MIFLVEIYLEGGSYSVELKLSIDSFVGPVPLSVGTCTPLPCLYLRDSPGILLLP
jgi:hypothetical protein